MFILGLTGSLGMGKSATAKMFAEEGVPVHDADAVVHRLYDGEAAPQIEAAFPGTTQDGKVDREKLGKRVLGDPAAIKRLERIVHPLVGAARDAVPGRGRTQAVPRWRCSTSRCCSRPAAISAATRWWWYRRRPTCSATRAFERPGMTEQKLAALLAKQMPDAEKRARADFVVDTSQGFEAARAQVRDILRTRRYNAETIP